MIAEASSPKQLNRILLNSFEELGIPLPWDSALERTRFIDTAQISNEILANPITTQDEYHYGPAWKKGIGGIKEF